MSFRSTKKSLQKESEQSARKNQLKETEDKINKLEKGQYFSQEEKERILRGDFISSIKKQKTKHFFDLSNVEKQIIQAKNPVQKVNKFHVSKMLFKACKNGQVNAFKEIQIHIDDNLINQKDELGNTPLYYACLSGNILLVAIICNMGADINAKNEKNNTAMHAAFKINNENLVYFLLKRGANPMEFNSDYEAPIDFATDVMIEILGLHEYKNFRTQSKNTELLVREISQQEPQKQFENVQIEMGSDNQINIKLSLPPSKKNVNFELIKSRLQQMMI